MSYPYGRPGGPGRVRVGRVLVGVGLCWCDCWVVWWGWLLLRWLLAWRSLWFGRVVLSRADRIRRRRPGRLKSRRSRVITIGLMCWVVSFISESTSVVQGPTDQDGAATLLVTLTMTNNTNKSEYIMNYVPFLEQNGVDLNFAKLDPDQYPDVVVEMTTI